MDCASREGVNIVELGILTTWYPAAVVGAFKAVVLITGIFPNVGSAGHLGALAFGALTTVVVRRGRGLLGLRDQMRNIFK